MLIPEEILKRWKVLRSENDTKEIAKACPCEMQTVRNAFKYGKCSDNLFKAMAAHYQKKSELIQSVLTLQ